MGIVSSVASHTLGTGWRAVKDTVRGAIDGEIDDIAKIALVAGMATGSVPVATGVAALASDAAVGTLIDVFA